jgi:hypothetical protein
MYQNKILEFKNIHLTNKNHYGNHPYGSKGYIKNWVYFYFGYPFSDNISIDDRGSLIFQGKKIGDYRLDDDLGLPIFTSISERFGWASEKQSKYISGIKSGLLDLI